MCSRLLVIQSIHKFVNRLPLSLMLVKIVIIIVSLFAVSSCTVKNRSALFRGADTSEGTRPIRFHQRGSTIGDLKEVDLVIESKPLEETPVEQVIDSYRQALSLFTTASARQEALRRMADLTMVATEDRFINEVTILPKEFNQSQHPKVNTDESTWSGNSDTDSDFLSEADSRNDVISNLPTTINYASAIILYQELLKNPETIANHAEALYLLAKAYDLNGQPDESLLVLNKLITQFKDSPFHDEVQFRRGEMLFFNGEYLLAAQAYEDVLVASSSDAPSSIQTGQYYEHSLYKQGWTYYKLSDNERALDYFIRLLDHLDSGRKTQASRKTLDKIRTDTHRVASMSFSNLEGPSTAEAYFKQIGQRAYEYDIYKALAAFYLHQERYLDAAASFQSFVNNHPLHPQAPNFNAAIIEVYRQGSFPSLILPIKEQFVTQYGINSHYWKNTTPERRDLYKPQLKRHLIELAQHYHSNAQVSKKPGDHKKATIWYREFLTTFPNSADAKTMNRLLAESLFSAKDFVPAIREFEITAYDYEYNLTPGGEAAEAGYFALLAYQELLTDFHGSETEKQSWLEKKTDSALRFVLNFPDHIRTPQIVSNIVEDQLAMNDLDGAIKTSRMILELQPRPPEDLLSKAWQTIANGEFDLGHYSKAETALDIVLSSPSVTGTIRSQFNDRLAAAIYRQAESLKSRGLKAEAANEFLRVGAKQPNAAIRINADYDAGALLLELQEWNTAISLFEGFRQRYPQHTLTSTLPPKLALAYEKTEQWEKASSEFETIAAQNPDPNSDQARQAIWVAAEYQDKANNTTQAIRLYKHYVWTYPQPLSQKVEGQYRLVQLYESKGNVSERDDSKFNFWLNQLVKSYDNGGETSDRIQYLAAYAAFTLAEPSYHRFKAIELTLPLKKSLKKKKQAMNEALKSYIKTTEIGVSEFATAGTFRIGDIYISLAADLMNSQRPAGLSELELEQYEILLEEQALPFEDQAIDILESNAELTLDNIYDEWVKKSFKALGNLLPGRYAKQEQIEPFIETIY